MNWINNIHAITCLDFKPSHHPQNTSNQPMIAGCALDSSLPTGRGSNRKWTCPVVSFFLLKSTQFWIWKCQLMSMSVNFVANKMLFITCLLYYFILYFKSYHCLGRKEITTCTTYAYSDCGVFQYCTLCRESRCAIWLRGGIGPGVRWGVFCG